MDNYDWNVDPSTLFLERSSECSNYLPYSNEFEIKGENDVEAYEDLEKTAYVNAYDNLETYYEISELKQI